MKRISLAALAVAAIVTLSGCAGMQVGPGTTTGAAVGAIGGAVLDHRNPAAGALIGGALGAVIGNSADQQNGYNNGPVAGSYRGGYCDWRCQDWRREEARREEARRWENYCRRNWQFDRRCR